MSDKAAAARRSIIVTGDVLRPAEDGFRPGQTGNIRWFHRLFRRRLEEATGLPVELRAWGAGFDTPAFYAVCGATPDVEGWARLHAAPALPVEALGMIARAHAGAAAVVGFEMAESVKAALALLGIPVLDFTVHPVRFGPDVFFAVQASHPEVFAALLPHHAEGREFLPWADLAAAAAQKLPPLPADLPGDLLVVGQTRVDRTLLHAGRVVSLADVGEALRGLAAHHHGVLFKPHPYGEGEAGLLRSGLPFRAVRRTRANVYALLAHEGVARVAGLSSSVLEEARYFGKPAEFLLRRPFDIPETRAGARPGQHLGIVEACFATDFWRTALAPLVPVTARDGGAAFRRPPNALRMSLRNFWGFNELTTDAEAEAREASARMAAGGASW